MREVDAGDAEFTVGEADVDDETMLQRNEELVKSTMKLEICGLAAEMDIPI